MMMVVVMELMVLMIGPQICRSTSHVIRTKDGFCPFATGGKEKYHGLEKLFRMGKVKKAKRNDE